MGRRCKSTLIFTNNQENAKSWYHFCQLLLKVQGNTRAYILLWEHKPQQLFRRIVCHLIILHGKIFWPGNSRTFISHRQKTSILYLTHQQQDHGERNPCHSITSKIAWHSTTTPSKATDSTHHSLFGYYQRTSNQYFQNEIIFLPPP